MIKLIQKEIDDFRRYHGSFEEMVQNIYSAGYEKAMSNLINNVKTRSDADSSAFLNDPCEDIYTIADGEAIVWPDSKKEVSDID